MKPSVTVKFCTKFVWWVVCGGKPLLCKSLYKLGKISLLLGSSKSNALALREFV